MPFNPIIMNDHDHGGDASRQSKALPLYSQPVLLWQSTQDTRRAELAEQLLQGHRTSEHEMFNLEPVVASPSSSSSRLLDAEEKHIIPGRRQRPVPLSKVSYMTNSTQENVFIAIAERAAAAVERNAYAKKRYKEKLALRQAQSSKGVSSSKSDLLVPQGSRSERMSDSKSSSRSRFSSSRTPIAGRKSLNHDLESAASAPPMSYSAGTTDTDMEDASISNSTARTTRPSDPDVSPSSPSPSSSSSQSSRSSSRTKSSSSVASQGTPQQMPPTLSASMNPTSSSESTSPVTPTMTIPVIPTQIATLPYPNHALSPSVPVAPMAHKPRAVSPVQRRSQVPPPLGMRRAPYSVNLETKLLSQPPVKQRPFKPPLARPPGDQQPAKVLVPIHAHPQVRVLNDPKRVVTPRSRSTSPNPAADSSYGDIDIDINPDALDEAMREYD